jgi:hypothetical protein
VAAKAKPVDWAAVERDYRAGVLTNTAIGKKQGISHTAVQKRAKAESWTRDLSKRIEAARDAKVSRSIVSSKVSKQRAATDDQVVQANATLQSDVIVSHRKDIQALRVTVAALAGELGAVSHTDLQAALEIVLDEKLKATDSEARKTALLKAYNAAMALGSRAGAGRQLAAALSTLIDKERQAFGIDKESGSQKSIGEWLESLT